MQRTSISSSWGWVLGVAVTSLLVGVRHAHDLVPPPTAAQTATAKTPSSSVESSERVERLQGELAQAGCPGWIVLASEGETALHPLPQVNARKTDLKPDSATTGLVQQTAHRAYAGRPRLQVPVRLPIAPGPQFRTARSEPQPNRNLAPHADELIDDLLDGVPDLLHTPTATPPSRKPEPFPNSDPPTQNPATNNGVSAETEKITHPPVPQSTSIIVPQQPKQPVELPDASQGVTLPGDDTLLLDDMDDLLDSTPAVPPALRIQPAPRPVVRTTPPSQGPGGDLRLPSSRVPSPAPVKSPLGEPIAVPQPQPTPPHAMPRQPAIGPSQRSPEQVTGQAASVGCQFEPESLYPSAQTCRKCHEKIYEEWSVSSHAYAMVSPMFHKFEQKVYDLTSGTIGYFCYRCHSPAGVSLGISRAAPLWDLPKVAREGITCVSCHRVNQIYGKVNGERRVEPGPIFAPVYGSIGGDGVATAIAQKNKFKVKTSPHDHSPGQDIHVEGRRFEQLHKSEFCVSCHQVSVHPGIKLEVVWEQYRASPACKKGISCQDCHMGRIPGVPSGYEYGAAAVVNNQVVHPGRKHANHQFYGPGYSIAHPGIFPHNPKADRWSPLDWLQFDHQAGWGTDEFEDRVERGEYQGGFPPAWAEVDDRYDAREIIEENLAKLAVKRVGRLQVMENSSHVDGPFFDGPRRLGKDLRFHYVMTNTNEGHNLLTGSLGAQPQLWANVVLIGPNGRRLWETGYTDRWGDVADIHSEDVRHKRIPYDWQLFNLQTKFLITGATGTDR